MNYREFRVSGPPGKKGYRVYSKYTHTLFKKDFSVVQEKQMDAVVANYKNEVKNIKYMKVEIEVLQDHVANMRYKRHVTRIEMYGRIREHATKLPYTIQIKDLHKQSVPIEVLRVMCAKRKLAYKKEKKSVLALRLVADVHIKWTKHTFPLYLSQTVVEKRCVFALPKHLLVCVMSFLFEY